jgi:hypothetical protein
MNRDDILKMAQEAGAFWELSETPEKDVAFLMRFAERAIRAAIEQAEKPVAYLVEYLNGEKEVRFQPNGWGDKVTPLYTAPRQWVGLTDEEVNEFYWISASTLEAIEAKLKEKNI